MSLGASTVEQRETIMKNKIWISWMVAIFGLVVLIHGAAAQAPGIQEKVAALKQALQQNQARLKQYEWIETTVVSKNGEEKSRKQNRCYYGADGKLQKVPLASSQEQGRTPRGLRGAIVKAKKEEMVDYLEQASALIKRYVPPSSAQIQASLDAGKASIRPEGVGKNVELAFQDYLLPGDLLSVDLDLAKPQVTDLNVATYLENPKDAVTLEVSFGNLQDGTSYPEQTVMTTKKKDITVTVQNSGYRKMGS